MKNLMLGAALALTIAGPAFAQVMTPDKYVMTAGASDLYERQSSELVLQSTQNPQVRAFATMMIDDHGKSTMEVKAAAQRSGLPASPPQLTPLQNELMAELNAERGPARDALYIAQQKAAHGGALTVQKAYAMDGTDPALRSAAARIVPVVEHHIALLEQM